VNDLPAHDSSSHDAAALVRQNTVSAAIAAGALLYFAFSGGGYELSDGDTLFDIGGRVFVRTLQIGGFAMAAAALWCMTGMVVALLFDAIVSIIIGLSFCVSAAMMLMDGGPGVLYIAFGMMFIVAGVRNGRQWADVSSAVQVDDQLPPHSYDDDHHDQTY